MQSFAFNYYILNFVVCLLIKEYDIMWSCSNIHMHICIERVQDQDTILQNLNNFFSVILH